MIEERNEYMSEATLSALKEATGHFKENSKSKDQYFGYIRRLTAFLKKDFADVTNEDVRLYFEHLKLSKKKKTTLATALGIFRVVASKFDESNGTELLQSFSGINIESGPKELTADELPLLSDIDAVLTSLKEKGDRQTFGLISLELQTALTSGELCSLKVQSVIADAKDRYYLKLDPKTSEAKARYFSLSGDVAEILTSMVLERKNRVFATDALFTNKSGNPLSQRQMEQAIKRACFDAKVRSFTINDLRTTAMAVMLKAGISTDKLKDITDNTGRWLFRLNRVVEELPNENVVLNHINIIW